MNPRGASSAAGSTRHRPQLDGLRAFAILFVLIQHGFPAQHALVEAAPWGSAGVRLFFVLSGYLITKILLDARAAAGRAPGARRHLFRAFYARRALRILPVYFLVLGVTAALDAPGVRETWIWLATFTSNLLFAKLGQWPGFVSHLWSLAVEEQFYLFWPLVIVFVPRRSLTSFVLFIIALAPLWRLYSISAGHNEITTSVFTLGCFDSLGMGALLAIARDAAPADGALLEKLRGASLLVGGPLLGLSLGLYATGLYPGPRLFVQDFAMALVFTWVVDRACDGFGGLAGRTLSWAPIRYVGRISYGLYLYHRFVRGFLFLAVSEGHLPPPATPLERFLRIVVVSFVLASASWHLFESPINGLKHRFEYARPSPDPEVDSSAR